MRTYTADELKAVLELHTKWRYGQPGGVRANLRSANLYGANLRSADLRSANLGGADLYGANLRSANLGGADLYGANLRSADLGGANLYGADLGGADLYGANLRSADLGGANLYGANLGGADLYGANLGGANLYGADLYGANLRSANLGGAKDLDPAAIRVRTAVPQEGAFRAFKKAYLNRGSMGRQPVVVVLEIPEDAKRLGGLLGRKCRADAALVLGFRDLDGNPIEETAVVEAYSGHDSSFMYRTGETVTPTNGFEEDAKIECAAGIHFFTSFEEAAEYC